MARSELHEYHNKQDPRFSNSAARYKFNEIVEYSAGINGQE